MWMLYLYVNKKSGDDHDNDDDDDDDGEWISFQGKPFCHFYFVFLLSGDKKRHYYSGLGHHSRGHRFNNWLLSFG